MNIGIIGAMEIEVTRLRDELKNREEVSKAGFTFYKGQIHGIDIVLLQSGIGKVNAVCSGLTNLPITFCNLLAKTNAKIL